VIATCPPGEADDGSRANAGGGGCGTSAPDCPVPDEVRLVDGAGDADELKVGSADPVGAGVVGVGVVGVGVVGVGVLGLGVTGSGDAATTSKETGEDVSSGCAEHRTRTVYVPIPAGAAGVAAKSLSPALSYVSTRDSVPPHMTS
jgi:hypothetical protein